MSVSVFACGAILALLIMAGLLVDGAAQMLAKQRAEDAAAQVARFAMDAAAPYLVDGQDGSGPALAAARSASGHYDNITFQFTIESDGALRVTTHTSVPAMFLCLIGIGQLGASGDATAIVYQPK